MNGYEMMADTYRQYLKSTPDISRATREDIERKIKSLDIMAETDTATKYELFNSCAFNGIAKGYFLKALHNIGANKKTVKNALKEIDLLFDEMGADKAEAYFMEH